MLFWSPSGWFFLSVKYTLQSPLNLQVQVKVPNDVPSPGMCQVVWGMGGGPRRRGGKSKIYCLRKNHPPQSVIPNLRNQREKESEESGSLPRRLHIWKYKTDFRNHFQGKGMFQFVEYSRYDQNVILALVLIFKPYTILILVGKTILVDLVGVLCAFWFIRSHTNLFIWFSI